MRENFTPEQVADDKSRNKAFANAQSEANKRNRETNKARSEGRLPKLAEIREEIRLLEERTSPEVVESARIMIELTQDFQKLRKKIKKELHKDVSKRTRTEIVGIIRADFEKKLAENKKKVGPVTDELGTHRMRAETMPLTAIDILLEQALEEDQEQDVAV
ncbi:MAG: hypothetical protein ABIH21_05215 [Patescibacteria group bacterium]